MLHFPFHMGVVPLRNLTVLQTGPSVAAALLFLLRTDESFIKVVAIGAMSQT